MTNYIQGFEVFIKDSYSSILVLFSNVKPISSKPSRRHFFLKESISKLILAPFGLDISFFDKSIFNSGLSVSKASASDDDDDALSYFQQLAES